MLTDYEKALLPKRTVELIDVVGMDAAFKLVERFGGTHLNIPKRANPSHKLCTVIQPSEFAKLCAYYGGTVLEIDRCTALLKNVKHRLILEEFNNGMTNAELARKYQTTERQIRRIKRKFLEEKPLVNVDLFEMLLNPKQEGI
jgi:Mor family transcriptional regulator